MELTLITYKCSKITPKCKEKALFLFYMKKKICLLLLIVGGMVSGIQTASAQDIWTLDKAHARLGFSITHLMLSEVNGNFTDFDITLRSSKEDFSDAVITVKAPVSFLTTGNEKRDSHLQQEEFFYSEKYPMIFFKSDRLEQMDMKKYRLIGDLTIRGITKKIALDVQFNGIIIHPYTGKPVAGFQVKCKFNRKDFGVGQEYKEAVLSNEVEIEANLEFRQGL